HMLEHMMFKGTKNFGTLDLERDQRLQEQIEAAHEAERAEARKRTPDQALIKKKRAEMEALRREVQKIYVPQVFSSQLERNGARGVNAFTSKDQTQYMTSVPSDMLEQWFSIASEQVFEPSWREFYVEREVVQREWAYRYVNSPRGAVWLDLAAAAYTAHPYRNPTIGWKSDMEQFAASDAREFHDRFYTASNAVCVLVGDITAERARELAETYFGRYPRGIPAPESVTREPPAAGPRQSIRFLKGARTPLVRIGFHGADMGTPDFYALDALTMVLSHGRGARLTLNVVNQGLAMRAWAYNPDNRLGGVVILGGSPNEPEGVGADGISEAEKRALYLKGCRDLEKILLAEVRALAETPVSRRELARIKKLNERDFLDRLRGNEDLAGSLATMEVQIGWRYLNEYLPKIAAVTPERVMEAAKKHLDPEKRISVYLVPGGEPDQPLASYTENRSSGGAAGARMEKPTDMTNHSVHPTPAGWRHPLSFDRKPEKIVYPRAETAEAAGAPVYYLPDHELPLIDLTLLVKAGSVDEPLDKFGLTDLLSATIIRGGAGERTPDELALFMDENAIRASVSVSEEAAAIHLSVMKEDWKKGLSLLKEILTRPRFDPDVIATVKARRMTNLKRQADNAHAISAREGMIWRFKDHVYGRDPLRGLETIPTITPADLRRFLHAYFTPANMVAAVSGSIDKESAVSGLADLLGALPDHGAPAREFGDPAPTPPVLALIHKPGQVQSQVVMGLPSVKRTHPDYWKISLLMDIFGGGSSLMYTRLRDDLGLVYSAGFHQSYKWRAGLLTGYIGCRADKTAEAIRESLNIMDALRAKIPERDFRLKRLDVLNGFVFNVDSPAKLVEVYGRYRLREEPLDTLEKIQDAFIGATREELGRLALAHLRPEAIQIFVTGDKNTLVEKEGGERITLERDLKALAKILDLPFREIPLR
ncbi:MAG: insulinase family protein, partial [Desulfobacterales bacterium]|nr:insulinase family protein [Desulfobacterales bacterium]